MSSLFSQAKKCLVGGVNSPVRSFQAVGGEPIFIKSAKGAYLTDSDNKKYIDLVNSWGANLLGHADDRIISAVQEQIKHGLSYGAPCELETKCAELILDLIPSIEKIRFVNSGTEAVMSALRLARGYTKKNKIIKFIGNYHGHSDSLLVEAGSGASTLGVPNSPGIVPALAKETISLEYNDEDALINAFEKYGAEIACVICEPIAGNMNFVMAKKSFLSLMRKLCDKYKAILIFDEVMTGFRVAKGGAQSIYNITPDLTTFAKVIGGGMPVGAFGGKAEIMSYLAPEGPVYQAGTLSGNPVAMAAGIAVLSVIKSDNDLYNRLSSLSKKLVLGMRELADIYNQPFFANYCGGMFGFGFLKANNFNNLEILNFSDIKDCDSNKFNKFFHFMLNKGVYFAPSCFEAGFVSAAHTEDDINIILEKIEAFYAR